MKKNITNDCGAFLTDIELRNRPGIIMRVVGHINGNDAMLRRSAQLLLTAENEHPACGIPGGLAGASRRGFPTFALRIHDFGLTKKRHNYIVMCFF